MTIRIMQASQIHGRALAFLLYVGLVFLISDASAFPPAPSHTVYGVVRDQVGNPISNGAEVILEASSGTTLRTTVAARIDSSVNYELSIPMDAGLTADRYMPTALMPAAPFKLKVKVGNTVYVPMEMTGNLTKLGIPAGKTRIDLTLGVDTDGNGLPDAWEKAVAAKLGQPWVAGKIKPGDLFPGTGMTYQEVYVAGTYSVSPKDGFALNLLNAGEGAPRLAFTAVKGRAYTVQSCSVIGEWATVSFGLLPRSHNAPLQQSYVAQDTRRVEIEVPASGDQTARFFRLLVE